MTDLYLEMCRVSPVQKEWIYSIGDLTDHGVVTEIYEGDAVINSYVHRKYVWLPRQEDYQELCDKNKIPDPDWDKWINENWDYYKYAPTEGKSLSWVWNMRWRLYTHLEVYGLRWDWDNKQWVNV